MTELLAAGQARANDVSGLTHSRVHHRGLATWTLVVMLFLWAPLLVVVTFSFNGSPISSLPMRGLTLKWYAEVFGDSVLGAAILNSFKVAALVVPVSTILGTMAAIGISRYVRRFRSLITGLVIVPVMTPALIIGIALLSLFNAAGARLSLMTVAASHVVVTMPYVVLIVSARLVGIDMTLEEAAVDLGASRTTFLRRILLPLLAPAIVAAALIVFTLSFDEIVVTFFTIGNQNTLPMFIWGLLRTGITPEINALSSLLIVASLLIAVGTQQLIRPKTTKRRRRSPRSIEGDGLSDK